MKIRILFILICFFSSSQMIAQSLNFSYRSSIVVNITGTSNGNTAGSNSYFTLTVVYADGSTDDIMSHDLTNLPGNGSRTYSASNIIRPSNNRIVEIRVFSKNGGAQNTLSAPIGHFYPCVNTSNGLLAGYKSTVTFTSRPFNVPLQLDVPSENSIGDLDANTIHAPAKGSHNSFSFYNWEYQIEGETTWRPFPSRYIGEPTVTLTANDLFEGSTNTVNALAGKNIFIRINTCSNTPSAVVVLALRKSAPGVRVTNGVEVTNAKCSNSSDGKYKVWFDRSLINGESLILNLRDTTHPGLFYEHQIDASDLAADNSYTFPENLQKATYYLRYQNRVRLNGVDQQSVPRWANTTGDFIDAPAPVTFTTTETNVKCYGGSDGSITIAAVGGTNSYQYNYKRATDPDHTNWTGFTNTITINGLSDGDYIVKIRDGNACAGTSSGLSEKRIRIAQPTNQLRIATVGDPVNPTAFGSSDGYIEVDVTGGTPNSNTYNFEWRDINTNNVITTNISTSVETSGYRIRLAGLGKGDYSLQIRDNNYTTSTTPAGCTTTNLFTLVQPDPLTIRIETRDIVRCNGEANGILVAHGNGGISFPSPANPYTYVWKKLDALGVWQILPAYTDSVAAELEAGWYAVNITDRNGISLVADQTFQLGQPDALQLVFTKTDVTCTGMRNGAVQPTITGGNGGYAYEWSNGATTQDISALDAGHYFLIAKDIRGCEIDGTVQVNEGVTIAVTAIKVDPTCHDGTNGSITTNATGGTAPYTYTWTNTTTTTSTATNLSSGTYTVRATDANGCFDEHTETLLNPISLAVNLGSDRFICANQSISYDISINQPVTYAWRSKDGSFASSQSKVTLNKGGEYIASITDVNGCPSLPDTVVLTQSNATIGVSMVLPSQAFKNQQVIAVNVSNPAPDRIEWVLPDEVQIISQDINQAKFTFKTGGTFEVGLKAYVGECYDYVWKKIIVNERSTPGNSTREENNSFIQHFSASPNPSNGNFTLKVALKESSGIRISFYDILNLGQKKAALPRQAVSDSYTITLNTTTLNLSPGMYLVLLEEDGGNSSAVKLIVI